MKKDKFDIYAFSSPYVTDEAYRDYAECGYTAVLIDQNEGGPGTESFERVLSYCDRYGIEAYPMSYGKNFPYEGDATDYAAHPSFSGVCFWDEPLAREIPQIGTWAEDFEKTTCPFSTCCWGSGRRSARSPVRRKSPSASRGSGCGWICCTPTR